MAIKLTKDYDVVTGTDGNDSFIAKVLGNSNTFQSGDEVDGGAGTDTLNIVLGNESGFAISAETTSVEKVSVRSQSTNTDGNSGANNISYDDDTADRAEGDDAEYENVIDAQDMVGVKEFWNTDSRADLVIEDVRIGGIANPAKNAKGQIVTENVTIGWKNTDPASMDDKVDYEVYFSPESLRKTDGASTISLQWMDTRAATDGDATTAALENLNYQGIKLKIGGETKEISSDAINDAKTYDALIKAFNAAFKEAGVAVTATKGTVFKATDTKSGVKAAGNNITLSSDDGKSLSFVDVVTKGSVPTDFGAHSNPIGVNTPGFITSKVVLDNVGRESEAGDLVIGSMSTRSGVDKFKVDVLRTEGKNVETMGNWVSSMSSTNEKLQEVVITKNDGAYLYVGSQDGSTAYESGVANNNLTVDREVPTFVNTDGLTDVRVFNASKMTGDVKVGATLANTDGKDASDTSKKYLLSKMSIADKAYYDADDTDGVDALNDGYVEGDGFVDFNYSTGSGNDTVNLAIADQCDVNIKTADGNDAIQLNVSVVLGGQININVGSGNNSIILDNEGTIGWSADTIVIDTVFGADTVKNFNATNDKLDFTKYATKANSHIEDFTSTETKTADILADIVKQITADHTTKGSFLVLDLDQTTASETDYNAYSVVVDTTGTKATLIGNIDIAQNITDAMLA